MDDQRKRDYQKIRYANLDAEAKRKKIQSAMDSKRNNKYMSPCLQSVENSTSTDPSALTSWESNFLDKSSSISELYTLGPHRQCSHCNATLFQFEPPSLCCSFGDILLPHQGIPSDLYDLYTGKSIESKEFRSKIRAYNSMFAFTSFGAHVDPQLANSKNGVYTFRVQGQIYHSLPPLLKGPGSPCFFQLYIYDTDYEATNRINAIKDANLNENIVKKLMSLLIVNPYGQFFRSLCNRAPLNNIDIHIRSDLQLDQRVYNAPVASQVAAIWIEGNHTSDVIERDIILTSNSGTYRKIKHYFGCYDPLQYPLLFPFGEVGWHQTISRLPRMNRTNRFNETLHVGATEDAMIYQELQGIHSSARHRVSCREYYSYKLQIRSNDKSIILHSGRLLHQYVVDMYVKIETSRLDFYRRNQHTIRSDLYKGVVDSVAASETSSKNIGTKIILPASFIGGPRDMRRRYLDAMALVQHFGKPDLFVTFTCNPDWIEIQKELLYGETAQDRPDLSSRVFRAKIHDLKDQILRKHVLGVVRAYAYVIEFQKRGLPHAHLLIILHNEYRLRNSAQFDKLVSAEIPDPFVYKRMHDTVVKHMMHGPCGSLNIRNVCMRNGVCKNKYPRFFSNQTCIGDDSYPIYRRRNNGMQAKVRNCILDNRWVVPYNPYLLCRYNCHVNVEICSGIKAVKYIYKYLYKGHDKIAMSLRQPNTDHQTDEITQYQDGRWVSAPEALWRIYEFELSEMYPSVCNLQLHLQDMHYIYMQEAQNLTQLLENDNTKKTMLTEFFVLNKNDPEARTLLYREIPQKYVWNKTRKYWKKREKQAQIGRINTSNPSEGERYYLRMILNHVYGPTSFLDLMHVNGAQCSSFKEVAEKCGLLETDDYIFKCLQDATLFEMPSQLRQLFAMILVYWAPTNARELWDSCFADLCHDFLHAAEEGVQLCLRKTLLSVNECLLSMGSSVDAFDLPTMPYEGCPPFGEADIIKKREILEELNIVTPLEDINAVNTLNADQTIAYVTIVTRVRDKKSGLFFIDGPGGTGKTYLYRAILATLRTNGYIALATATSGVAASILPGGRTAHSRFKIPINVTETCLCSFSKQSGLAHLLKKTSVILWDEAPMANRMIVECLDRTLRDIMENDMHFGGKVVVFGGDFRQVLPVVRRASKFQNIQYSIVASYLWSYMEIYKLRENIRAINDSAFCDFILSIGNGSTLQTDDGYIRIPDDMLIMCDDDKIAEELLFDAIFPSLNENALSSSYFTERAILATKNNYVDKINQKLVKNFSGEETIFYSFDSVVDDVNNLYQIEFLNTLTPSGLPPHKLVLKKNCPIMLLRNLDPSNGLCNGTRMICRSFKRNVILAEVLTGQACGKTFMIPRIPLSPNEDENLPFKLKRNQFPIRLCFAMTINKSQGQTIPNVGIYLPENVFSHGQLYVALSRGISMQKTKVLIIPDKYVATRAPYTKNVVYKEMLATS